MDFGTFVTILVAGIFSGGIYALLAVNFNFQIGALKVTNFGYGAMLMFAMYGVFVFISLKVPIALTVLILMPIAYAFGWVVRRFIVFSENEEIQILLTMGLVIVLENLAHSIWGSFPRSLGAMEQGALIGEDIYISLTRFYIFLISLTLLGVGYLFLNKSWYGKCIKALVQNKDMASVIGINTKRLAPIVFGISAVYILFGAFQLMVFYSVEPHSGGSFLTLFFLICVMGGIGNLVGSLYSSFLVGILSSFISYYTPGYHDPILFFLFILIILIRPAGIFGEG